MKTFSIWAVVDNGQWVGYEFSDGSLLWFYDFDQDKFPGMQLGKYPRKSLDEDYKRILLDVIESDKGRQAGAEAIGL